MDRCGFQPQRNTEMNTDWFSKIPVGTTEFFLLRQSYQSEGNINQSQLMSANLEMLLEAGSQHGR